VQQESEDEDAADGSGARDTPQGSTRRREHSAGSARAGLSRNTVSKYLDQSVPVRGSYRRRPRPVWARVQPRLEELIGEWEPRTTAKQRLTGARLHRALLEEGCQVGLTTIYQYLRERRRQRTEVYVPLIIARAMKPRSTSLRLPSS
jgi:hypothetical protein